MSGHWRSANVCDAVDRRGALDNSQDTANFVDTENVLREADGNVKIPTISSCFTSRSESAEGTQKLRHSPLAGSSPNNVGRLNVTDPFPKRLGKRRLAIWTYENRPEIDEGLNLSSQENLAFLLDISREIDHRFVVPSRFARKI